MSTHGGGRIQVAVLVGALTLLAALPGVLVALTDGGPSVFMDEAFYRDQAVSIANFGPYANPHYPPVYPALLALAYLTSAPFRAMLVLNVVAGALIVPATWWLASELRLRHRWVPTLLSALLPVHAAFVGYLLSENLALPLFVAGVACAVRGKRRDAIIFGVALGALHLTRYFFLPVIVVLLVVWLLRVLVTDDRRRWRRALLTAAGGYLGMLALWVTYGLLSGYTFGQLWGLSTVEAGVGRSGATVEATLTWLTQYVSYLVVAAPAAWALIALCLLQTRWSASLVRRWSPVTAFGAVALTSVLGYLALATLHSRGVAYNFPDPSHMQGRYVMHLVPVVLVAACVALERLTGGERRPGILLTLGVGFSTAGATWAGWWVLFQGGLWAVPVWGAQLPFNAIDVFAAQDWRTITMLSLSAVVVPWMAIASVRAAVGLWSAVSVAVLAIGTGEALSQPINGLRERQIAEVVGEQTSVGSITIWLSDQLAAPTGVTQAMAFWGVDTTLIDVRVWSGVLDDTVSQACVTDSPGSDELWVTSNTTGAEALFRSGPDSAPLGIYRVRPGCMTQVVDDYERALAATGS